MITTARVTVVFGRNVALDSVDLVLTEGITGLFGQNAAGKSTLLRVLCGLLRPTSGSVTWDGHPVAIVDEELRRRIGYLGHDAGLYGRLSIRENLDLFATMYGASSSRVDEMLDSLEIGDRAGTPVHELSAGLKRRAGVARALLHDPLLLLLDEPYANLDDDASELVSSAVKAWRRPGRLGVIATHGAKRVKPFADAGVILQRGHVVSHRTRQPIETSR